MHILFDEASRHLKTSFYFIGNSLSSQDLEELVDIHDMERDSCLKKRHVGISTYALEARYPGYWEEIPQMRVDGCKVQLQKRIGTWRIDILEEVVSAVTVHSCIFLEHRY